MSGALVFDDLAPAPAKECRWLSTTGAGMGFLVALVGQQVVIRLGPSFGGAGASTILDPRPL